MAIGSARVASAAPPEAAFFSFRQTSPKGGVMHFVFSVTNEAIIREMRAALKDPSNPKRHVSGVVSPARVNYNPQWSFHLVPETAGLFEMQIEVCDANVTYLEAHLDEVGGSFLPKSFWCPWSSEIESELPYPPK